MSDGFEEIKLDDGFDALPVQDKVLKHGNGELQFGEVVPDPPRWMDREQRYAYYKKDLADFLGDDAGGAEEHPTPKNYKRSSRKEEPKPKEKKIGPDLQETLW